jgi:hypothetical protein
MIVVRLTVVLNDLPATSKGLTEARDFVDRVECDLQMNFGDHAELKVEEVRAA